MLDTPSFTGKEAITGIVSEKKVEENEGSDRWSPVQFRGTNPCHEKWKSFVEVLCEVPVSQVLQVKRSKDKDWVVNDKSLAYKKVLGGDSVSEKK